MGDLLIRPRLYVATIVIAIMAPTLGLLLSSNEKAAQAQNSPISNSAAQKPAPTDPAKQSEPQKTSTNPKNNAKTQTPSQTMNSKYPVHQNIVATVFWVGEDAAADNAYIANKSSAWASDWVSAYGGIDDPSSRNGYYPSFTPRENPFYFALPYGDFTSSGIKANVNRIYWYAERKNSPSSLKNRWIKVTLGGRNAYAQWQDVGPYEDDDVNYVFGTNRPKQRVGLDLSPAMQDYLGFKGMATVSWQFVDDNEVPTGPWKSIVTTSPPMWQ